VVLGGEGPIDTSLLEQLVGSGLTVRVMTSDRLGLPDVFQRPEVQLLEGDLADPAELFAAVEGARGVVHLADADCFTWEAADSSIDGARKLAEACARSGVERLIYVSSIASLDLSDPRVTITGSKVNDRAQQNGSERAGIECDLVGGAREASMPLTILRAGIVLGAGATPFHPGFGIWRGGLDCVGWSRGTNPLPLVLASDVAAAIQRALESELGASTSYNLVGDVRLSAREYVGELRERLQRPFVFHPVRLTRRYLVQAGKWFAKMPLRRPTAGFPSYASVKSRGFFAEFDCSDVKDALGWAPVTDRIEFLHEVLRDYGG